MSRSELDRATATYDQHWQKRHGRHREPRKATFGINSGASRDRASSSSSCTLKRDHFAALPAFQGSEPETLQYHS